MANPIVDLNNYYVSIFDNTPVLQTKLKVNNVIDIVSFRATIVDIKEESHRDPSYQASYNRCTSSTCSDYTEGFNYIPSCGSCEQPLDTQFGDTINPCFSSTLLSKIDFNWENLLETPDTNDTIRDPDLGGGFSVVDNIADNDDPANNNFSNFYSSWVHYSQSFSNTTTDGGWRGYAGKNGKVSYNKFYALTGYWLDPNSDPCLENSNYLYQCAVSCETGDVVGCWTVGYFQRPKGEQPIPTSGEVEFGSVWAITGLEEPFPTVRKYYQIYDPLQIVASGISLIGVNKLGQNPTNPTNGYEPLMMSESCGGNPSCAAKVCAPIRTNVDFGDAEFLKDTNCLSSNDYRNTDSRCVTSKCLTNSYKPTPSTEKFNKPVNQLKFSLLGDLEGKVFTDSATSYNFGNCYFPLSAKQEGHNGRFLYGGPNKASRDLGYVQSTFSNLKISSSFYYGDCMSCLEAKANAKYEVSKITATNQSLISPFYNKCGVDFPIVSSGAGMGNPDDTTCMQIGACGDGAGRCVSCHRKYNIDCNCVRCGDVFITGAPKITNWNYANTVWGKLDGTPWETTGFLVASNLSKLGFPKNINCNPNNILSLRDISCYNHNSGGYGRIWYFWDKSKKFTDLGMRTLPIHYPTGIHNDWSLWTSYLGNPKVGDRAIVPFCITCYEQMNQIENTDGTRKINPTLSVVTGVKLAPISEYTDGEYAAKTLDRDTFYNAYTNTYLYYSRRASATILPCDSSNLGEQIGTYNCSCNPTPCIDDIMIGMIPVQNIATSCITGTTGSDRWKADSNLGTFPSIYEIHLEGDGYTVDNLYPLIGPNGKVRYGDSKSNFDTITNVGSNWDSTTNRFLFTSKKSEPTEFGFFTNMGVDILDPTMFWSKPITFLNTPGVIVSNPTNRDDGSDSYSRFLRLRDAYNISYASSAVLSKYGIVVPNPLPRNENDLTNPDWKRQLQ